jgi:hypothetical protein
MRVILDKETFGPSVTLLQPVADRVAFEVDNLIPGTPSDYPEDGIICFEAESSWNSTLPIQRRLRLSVPSY